MWSWSVASRRSTEIFSALLAVLEGHTSLVGRLGLHDDILVSASADGSICVWSLQDYTLTWKLPDHGAGAITGLHYSHPWIHGGHTNGTVRVWDAKTGELVREIDSKRGTRDALWVVALQEDQLIVALMRARKTIIEVGYRNYFRNSRTSSGLVGLFTFNLAHASDDVN